MGRNDDEELSEEEKARRGMAMMGLLDYIRNANASKEADDRQFKVQALNMANVCRIQYDAFVQKGFSRDEALALVKSIIGSVSPGGK